MYKALCLLTVTIHISIPSPTMKNPANYGLAGCTGVFISPNEVLTAGHCVSDSRGHQWLKTDDNISYSVSIEKLDVLNDLALLKVNKPLNHKYAKIGAPVKPADIVYTVNSGDDLVQTYNKGIVNNVFVDADTKTLTIMHNASILAGASGSGLFNNKGELVGINTAMLKSFSIAVDIEQVKLFLTKR